MINELHALFHRPEKGWDPVSSDHVQTYASQEWELVSAGLVPHDLEELEERIGGLKGKRVLDLGGGPGQYSIGMAERGAEVTWHDISRGYQSIVQQKAMGQNVKVETSLGYLEEAAKFADRPFDLVFNRICWRYAMNDRAFAKIVHSLVAPGGCGYIFEEYSEGEVSPKRRILIDFYSKTGIKIGHLYPLPGRIAGEIARLPLQRLFVEYDKVPNRCDVIFFKPLLPLKGPSK